jgi:hypothetical protein
LKRTPHLGPAERPLLQVVAAVNNGEPEIVGVTDFEAFRTNSEPCMSQSAAPNPQADAERLDVAADEATAACGGNARDAVKALIVANDFLESEVCELMQAVSHASVRGRFKTYTG